MKILKTDLHVDFKGPESFSNVERGQSGGIFRTSSICQRMDDPGPERPSVSEITRKEEQAPSNAPSWMQSIYQFFSTILNLIFGCFFSANQADEDSRGQLSNRQTPPGLNFLNKGPEGQPSQIDVFRKELMQISELYLVPGIVPAIEEEKIIANFGKALAWLSDKEVQDEIRDIIKSLADKSLADKSLAEAKLVYKMLLAYADSWSRSQPIAHVLKCFEDLEIWSDWNRDEFLDELAPRLIQLRAQRHERKTLVSPTLVSSQLTIDMEKIFGSGDSVHTIFSERIARAIREIAKKWGKGILEYTNTADKENQVYGFGLVLKQSDTCRLTGSTLAPLLKELKEIPGLVLLEFGQRGTVSEYDTILESPEADRLSFQLEYLDDLTEILTTNPSLLKITLPVNEMRHLKGKEYEKFEEFQNVWENVTKERNKKGLENLIWSAIKDL